MHAIVEIAFGIPVDGKGLHSALIIGGSGPYFIIAMAREGDGRRPSLPGKGVRRWGQVGLDPGPAKVVTDMNVTHLIIPGPGLA